jgi:hypothetical protein
MPSTLRIPTRFLAARVPVRSLPSTSIPFIRSRYYATESYGSSDHKDKDPANSKPSSKATHDMEHPGPPPPDTGSSTSGSSQSKSDSSSSKETESTPPAPEKPSNNASPKISDQRNLPPESEDAKKHNEEFENRHERSTNWLSSDGEDRVEKGFWSGQ